MQSDITQAGTIYKRNLPVKPIKGSVIDGMPAPRPSDFALIMKHIKPKDNQKFFVLPYYINTDPNSDTKVVAWATEAFETREEADKRALELYAVTGMDNWGVAPAYQPFVFKVNPERERVDVVESCRNASQPVYVDTGKSSYKEIEQQVYDKKVEEYIKAVEAENTRFEAGQKLSDPDSYEHFLLYLKTYIRNKKQLEDYVKEGQRLEAGVVDMSLRLGEVLEKHPDFLSCLRDEENNEVLLQTATDLK